MCTSRYFRVIEEVGDDAVLAEGIDLRRHRLALIAYEGEAPRAGTWIVAHAGYALALADVDEVALAVRELGGRFSATSAEHSTTAKNSKGAS